MKSLVFRVACLSMTAGAAAGVVACATADNDDETSTVTPPPTVNDGGQDATDGGVVRDAAPPPDDATTSTTCSAAGWCLTALPSYPDELQLNDIWPLADHAFAIAGTQFGSVRFLAWSEASDGSQQWSVIDDDSQHYTNALAGGVWAPNANEVYFTLSHSNAPGGEVYYGRRPVPPATDWAWRRFSFECDDTERPWVWGASERDVFVTSCGKVYRLSDAPDGGANDASSWIADHVDDSETDQLTFHGATGTSSDDAWFVGSRGTSPWAPTCAVVVHKTAAGYESIVDGTPTDEGCVQTPGSASVPIAGTFGRAEGAAIHAPAKNRFVALSFGTEANNDVVRIGPNGGGTGGYAVSVSPPLPAMSAGLRSVWGTSEDDLWFLVAPPLTTINDNASIVRGTNLWAAGGAFQYSTLVLDGVPNVKALQRIRGTSNTNIWAVGANRAFHKTTP